MLIKFLNPFWWFGFFGASFRWWFVCELFSLAVIPVCFFVFRPLKDRGYGFAKIFGIFFVTYVNWYLCTILSFSFGSVLFSLVVVLLLNLPFFLRQKDRILSFFKNRWKLILLYELLFLFAFLFFVNVRSYRPEAMFNPGESGAEKMLNCSYLHGLMRTSHFPPRDTWLWGQYTLEEAQEPNSKAMILKMKEAADAGEGVKKRNFYINYYYFGHLEWATIAKMSFYEARYAFNLGLATIFALSFIGAFSLGANLTRRLRWGLVAAFMVALFGNIDALQQLLERIGDYIAHKGETQTAWQAIMQHQKTILLSVDFWRTSRVIDNTVTEFPYFSAILGDLHPHHSSLPLVILALGTGMSLFLAVSRKPAGLKDFFRRYWAHFLFFALVIGGTFVTNIWDAIVLGFFGFVILATLHFRRHGNDWTSIWHSLVTVGVLGFLSVFLFLLFKMFFLSPIRNEMKIASFFPLKFQKFDLMVKPVSPNLRTELSDYFVLFGLFLFPVIFYFIGLFRRYLGARSSLVAKVWLAIALFFLVFSRNALLFWLPGLVLLWMFAAVAILIDGQRSRSTNYFLLLCLVAGFFTLFVETYFFDDRMVGALERYNTLFKIYYPLWSFLALAAAYSFAKMFRKAVLNRAFRTVTLLSLFLALTVIVGMLYPIQSTAMRTDMFQTSRIYQDDPKLKERSLDSTAYMHKDKVYQVDIGGAIKKDVNMKDDAEIIEWIRENVKGQPVVLEAIGGCYVPFSRISSMTGLPTLIGWTHHVSQHRGSIVYDITGPREEDVRKIYTNQDLELTKRLLKKYDIKYVMIGSLERAKFPSEGLEKLAKTLKPVKEQGESALYEVPWDVTAQ